MKLYFKILIFLAFIIPFVPKITISDGIMMYPYEIFALAGFPLLLNKSKFPIQKDLTMIWVIILFMTILSCIFVMSIGGLMRCIKELIYIPLVYLAFIDKWITTKKMCYAFIFACVANFLYIASVGFSFGSLNIWDSDLLSNGMSSKTLILPTMQVVSTGTGGSHGIWVGYSALSLCVAYAAYKYKEISKLLLMIVAGLSLVNLAMSVSREGFLIFVCLFYAIFRITNSKYGRFRLKPVSIVLIALFLCLIGYIVVNYGENLAIVQKIIYTSDSLSESGEEGNFSLRIGAWLLYFWTVVSNPLFILLGFGFNDAYYSTFIADSASNVGRAFVTIPESFFVEMAMYGGVFCLILGIKLWKHFFVFSKGIGSRDVSVLFTWLFIGLLIGNIISGASVICDLLYSQLLLTTGVFYRDYYKRLI